jgi:hypothetical protein
LIAVVVASCVFVRGIDRKSVKSVGKCGWYMELSWGGVRISFPFFPHGLPWVRVVASAVRFVVEC